MKLVESIMTKNPCYTEGHTITVQGLMLHSVGCAQPKASVFIKAWNRADYDRACVHAFVDGNDGTVYQTLPWNWRGWHCGSGTKGSGNNTHIGVELCEPAELTYTGGSAFTCSDKAAAQACAKRTYNAAVELFAQLCEKYALDPLTDICSHKEGHAQGIASNHGDPEHLWDGLGMGYTMDTFRAAVQAAMGGTSAAATTTGEVTTFPAVPFTVEVLIDDLNYRAEPSMSGAVLGQTGKGTFTIVEVSDGWGRLRSGAGWIWLGNAEYCTVGGNAFAAYRVKVTASALNVRKGPGTDYGVAATVSKGDVYTIVAESSGKGSDKGWGQLKSGVGWISLDFVEKV